MRTTSSGTDLRNAEPQSLEARLEEALRRLEPLEALMRHNPDLAARFDREYRHLYVNPAVKAATGIEAADFIGKTNEELGMPPELCHAWNEAFAEVFETGDERVIEFEYPGPEETRWYQSRVVPELDENGQVATVLGITRDITAQKCIEEELRRSRQELRDFFENAAIGLHWVGPDGTILWANRFELEMLGYTSDEYIARHIKEFHVDKPVIDDILDRLGRGEEIHEYEARLRGKDGRIRYVAISSNVLFENGEFVHTRCFTKEITARKHAEAERERLIRELQHANRAKSEFLATMSHELRTPLNAIVGYTDLMLAGAPSPLPESAREHLRRIGLSANHLIQIIGEVLTFSRIEAGRERMELATLRLSELVDEVTAIVEPLAMGKGLEFRSTDPPQDVVLIADPRKLRQILLNLVGNAVKFTERGAIRFRASPAGDRVRFEIEDTGIGIDPADHNRIFEPFWQAEPARSGLGGTGLGLSVAREFARLLGGDITMKSEPGRGTTFTVDLPQDVRKATSPG